MRRERGVPLAGKRLKLPTGAPMTQWVQTWVLGDEVTLQDIKKSWEIGEGQVEVKTGLVEVHCVVED